MTALLNNEFYEHLYKLEAQGNNETSWIDIVDDDNPDLVWCNKYIDNVLNESDNQLFIKELRSLMAKGYTVESQIFKAMHTSRGEFRRKLKESGMEKEFKVNKILKEGFILHHEGNQKLTFTRDSAAAMRYLKIKNKRSVSEMARKNRTIKKHRVYKAQHWLMVYPSFTLPEEELLNNEIIAIN